MKLAVALVLASTTAHADVDWARGLVTAEGIGVANRAAPSPAAARGPARRMAEDAARKKLAAQLPALPVAAGGTIGKAKLEHVVAHAIVVAAEPETDGSWRVTMAVPIEAVRQATAGPRTTSDDDKMTPVVVVEVAAGAPVRPAVGYTIDGIAAATVFVRTVPAWADAAPRVKAKGAKAGAITLAAPAAGVGEGTLFVVVTK